MVRIMLKSQAQKSLGQGWAWASCVKLVWASNYTCPKRWVLEVGCYGMEDRGFRCGVVKDG